MSSGGTGGLGSPQSLIDALDPLNLSGKASSSVLGNLVDPGNILGYNPQVANDPRLGGSAANSPGGGSVPSTLPNLGAASMMPKAPQGAFVAPTSGGGQFNDMAAALAGPLFNPSLPNPATPSTGAQSPAPVTGGGGGAPGVNLAALLAKIQGGPGMGNGSVYGPNAMVTLPATTPGGTPVTLPLAAILPQTAQQSAGKAMPYYSSLIQKV